MDKALSLLALARKGGIAELGEEPVGGAARGGKAYVILVAKDASDHTWRRALAIAAITDVQMALALVAALPQEESNKPALEVLTAKAAKARQRQQEAKAHRRNLRRGKKHVK